MTLILDLDPDIIKMYLHTENEVCRSRHLKLEPEEVRHTSTHTADATERTTTLHSLASIKH